MEILDYPSTKSVLVLHTPDPIASGGARILEQVGPAAGPKKGKNVDLYSAFRVLHTSNALSSLN